MPFLERTDAFLNLARSLRNWQLAAFLLAIADVVLAGGFVRMALQTRYVPYLVETDRDGSTTYAGPIEAVDLPEERLVVQQIRQFIWNLRVLVDDPLAQQELYARAYALADLAVRRKLDEELSRPESDPRRLAQKLSRSVEAITILRLPKAESTYQVHWEETSFERTGFGTPEVRSFQGLITVDFARQLSPESLALNPLGLLVTELTWTETTHRP